MHRHLQYNINFDKSTMKYVLIVHLFGIVDVNVFSNLIEVRESFFKNKVTYILEQREWNSNLYISSFHKKDFSLLDCVQHHKDKKIMVIVCV